VDQAGRPKGRRLSAALAWAIYQQYGKEISMIKKYLNIMHKSLGVHYISVQCNDKDTTFDRMIKPLLAQINMDHAGDTIENLHKYFSKITMGYQLLSYPSKNEIDKDTPISSYIGNVFIVISDEFRDEHGNDENYLPVDVFLGSIKKSLLETMTEDIIPDTEDKKDSVFVVHGHDRAAKEEVARFVERFGFNAIILNEQISQSMTIIEKLERYTDSGFGIVLYTPCDEGGKKGDTAKPRARQNVVFEHGYLVAKLGRLNVMALVKDNVDVPSDLSGVVYEKMDDSGAWKTTLAKELKTAGFAVDMSKL